VLAPVAESITALDLNPEVLEIARAKSLPGVEWCCRDLYAPGPFPNSFTAGFAGFWWSHVPRTALAGFLQTFHEQLEPGAHVMFLDNRYVSGSSTPVSRTDSDGNTFQTRTLADGTQHEVLKNFPSSQELTDLLSPRVDQLRVRELTHYWCVDYRVGQRAGGQPS
jgi:demethylmenaquinone methyltransferase/2-methoxy-6-polyprenyl-1,4-benzoquinol methylase